jgi:hypothetical protein
MDAARAEQAAFGAGRFDTLLCKTRASAARLLT